MLEIDPRWPGVVFNTTCLIGPEGILSQVSKGEHLDPVRSPRQPARSRGLRRAAVSGGRHANRTNRLRDLLRLAVSRGDPSTGRERRRSADPRLGVHGSVGRDRADELVDDRQSLPRPREHGVRRRGQPGRQPAALSAVLLARRQPDRRLRRADARRSVARSGERIVVAPIDITALRHERATRQGHHMLAHLRTEAYPVYARHQYPPIRNGARELSYERNVELIEQARVEWEAEAHDRGRGAAPAARARSASLRATAARALRNADRRQEVGLNGDCSCEPSEGTHMERMFLPDVEKNPQPGP